MYNDPTCKPWTSGSWAPVGYSSRRDYYTQKKTVETKTFDNGENATGVISGSVSSFEKSKENEKSNGVRISVSGVNRSSSILGNEGSAMGSGVEIIGSGASVEV